MRPADVREAHTPGRTSPRPRGPCPGPTASAVGVKRWSAASLRRTAIDPDDELVFIEVKTRSTEDFGHPFAAIGRDKARRTRALAILWCRLRESLDFARFRIDAIAVTGTCETLTFEHLKGVA